MGIEDIENLGHTQVTLRDLELSPSSSKKKNKTKSSSPQKGYSSQDTISPSPHRGVESKRAKSKGCCPPHNRLSAWFQKSILWKAISFCIRFGDNNRSGLFRCTDRLCLQKKVGYKKDP